MSKAEDYIRENTKEASNAIFFETDEISYKDDNYYSWLTPNKAMIAVKIAREEIYNWLANHYRDYMYNPTGEKLEAFFGMDMITDLKQAMKDE